MKQKKTPQHKFAATSTAAQQASSKVCWARVNLHEATSGRISIVHSHGLPARSALPGWLLGLVVYSPSTFTVQRA